MTTINEAIVAALEARGERDITNGSASKFRKFTRRYAGLRICGHLKPAAVMDKPTFWFVSRNGSLRVGFTSSSSRKAKAEVKSALYEEGLNAIKERKREGTVPQGN